MKKRRLAKVLPSCLTAGLMVTAQTMPVWAEEDTSLIGQMAFAQCEEYVNIRAEASTDGEVTAKIYNNGSVIIEEEDDGWYKIRSGNAEGYVKAEYFATGEEAEEIAEKVAYRVATVYPDELNIRTRPDGESGVIGSAVKDQELEVVAWKGDWMKVALSADEFGYVNAYYVDYQIYYPVAETLEEEQARLSAEHAAAETADYSGAENGTWEAETVEEESYGDDETYVPETEAETYVPETESYVPEDGSETYVPETESYVPETEAETYAPETEAYVPETEAETYAPETEAYVPETEAETYAPETEAYVPETETEAYVPETEAETGVSSGLGQQIADYGVQFVGNPYVWGGTSLTSGADCSGFVQSVFANFGIGLARTAGSQAYGGTSVSLDQLQPGDLLFYNSTGSIDHVALYIGGGQIVHAANSSSGIIISGAYYATPVCASRYW